MKYSEHPFPDWAGQIQAIVPYRGSLVVATQRYLFELTKDGFVIIPFRAAL